MATDFRIDDRVSMVLLMTGSQLSWQVRVAAALVAFGTVIGAGMIALAFMLMRNDPGFLFAVLPFVFMFLAVAGLHVAAFSLAVAVRLRRATPGVRLQVALVGGCVAASGFVVGQGSVPAAALLLLYGGTLVWLMTTAAAARDLGTWIAPARTRTWFGRGASPREHDGGGGAATPAWPPPWWTTWRAGLALGMPLWERALVAAALLAFAVGLISIPFGLARFPATWPPAALLIPLAIAVVWFVERRMKARLARR